MRLGNLAPAGPASKQAHLAIDMTKQGSLLACGLCCLPRTKQGEGIGNAATRDHLDAYRHWLRLHAAAAKEGLERVAKRRSKHVLCDLLIADGMLLLHRRGREAR